MPSRRSREGLGRGLLWSRRGDAKSRDVISSMGGSEILSGVSLGRLIKLPDFRVVLDEMSSSNSDWPLGWAAVSEEMR